MAKRGRKTKKKPETELSETPVIDEQQANAPAANLTVEVTATEGAVSQAEPIESEIKRPATMPRNIDEIPTTQRPVVEKKPPPTPPAVPVVCAGCKATVDASTTRACPRCPGSLVFCPTCAKPGTCHKCGKGLSK